MKFKDLKSLGEDEASGEWFECSECGDTMILKSTNFCSNCGVRIEH